MDHLSESVAKRSTGKYKMSLLDAGVVDSTFDEMSSLLNSIDFESKSLTRLQLGYAYDIEEYLHSRKTEAAGRYIKSHKDNMSKYMYWLMRNPYTIYIASMMANMSSGVIYRLCYDHTGKRLTTISSYMIPNGEGDWANRGADIEHLEKLSHDVEEVLEYISNDH